MAKTNKDVLVSISVRGVVQGVGFRPFVYQLATKHNLRGWVRNTSEDVKIEVEGDAADIEKFLSGLRKQAPPISRIEDITVTEEVIRRMAGVEPARRGARLRAAAALVYREHGREHGREHERGAGQEDGQEDGQERGRIHERVSEAALEGVIANRVWPRMRKGFPYRAVLFLPERGCYLGELSDEDAARLSQRRAALEGLRADLLYIAQAAGRG
ncbi:MAG: acylphosphatase [Candidatus Binataceae bacterium]